MTPPLDYETPQTVPVRKTAIVVLGLSIASALLCVLILPPAIMLLFSALAWMQAKRDPQGAGVMHTAWAIRISGVGLIGGILIAVLMPSLGGSSLSPRSVCAANLRGITQSLMVYATDNGDAFPIVRFAPYSAGLNDARAAGTPLKPSEMMKEYYAWPYRQAGSPQAILWQMVVAGSVSSKSFICPSDPYSGKAAGISPAVLTTPGGVSFDNFQSGRQLSYSMEYPWKADGSVGHWWRNATDETLPLMSDMAPLQGTGSPARDVRALTKASNTMVHQTDGQNVAFGDAHVEFVRLPNVGQGGDNIFTYRLPGGVGEVAADKVTPFLTADSAPFDVVMYPVRDETTGGF